MLSITRFDRMLRYIDKSGNYFTLVYFLCYGVGGYYSFYYYAKGLSGAFFYELFCLLIYLPVPFMAARGWRLAGPIAYVQFVHHQAVGLLCFGFASGFWLLLCCLYFVHFLFFKSSFFQIASTLLTTLVLAGFLLVDRLQLLAYVYAELADFGDIQEQIFLSNLLMSVNLMIIMGAIMNATTTGRIDQLVQISYTDHLTGLNNRKYLLERYEELRAKRVQLAVLDIDDFKQINDTYGHMQGDMVLKFLAILMQQAASKFDGYVQIARWGGEEFVILADANKADFCKLLEEIRSTLAECKLIENRQITISIGAYEAERAECFDELFEIADKNLYFSKRNGKNQIYFT